MSSDSLSASEAAINAGREHYAAKRYKPALEQFTKAMKLCPCTRGMKREKCSCKNFEEVASKDGSIFTEAMYYCRCSVGQIFNKCDKPMHIQALDYRAATFEALQELERARRDAEWIVELAPRLPDGYLRLGKVARLQKKYDFAWKIYTAGIEAGVANGAPKSDKLEQLYKARQPLQIRFGRKDPINFPIEIVQLIFSHMDLPTLVRCLGVSKTWKEKLSAPGNESLWRVLVFPAYKKQRTLRMDSLKKLLANSNNDVRELVIGSARQLKITRDMFHVFMNACKNLERLEVSDPSDRFEINVDLKNLKRVLFEGFEHGNGGDGVHYNSLILKAVGSVEDLCLYGLPQRWATRSPMPRVPSMPNLRFLKITGFDDDRNITSIADIFRSAPNIEQLYFFNPVIDPSGWEDIDFSPNLKVLRIMEEKPPYHMPHAMLQNIGNVAAYKTLVTVSRGTTLQYLDLSHDWEYSALFEVSGQLLGQQTLRYEKMQSFRVKEMVLDPEMVQQAFESCVHQGKMHTFDIVFPHESFQGPLGRGDTQHIDGYAWLRGAESIRCMGIFNFSFPSFHREVTMILVNFLASFPNLEVLEIDTKNYEEMDLFHIIRDILRATKLKKLYQSNLKGAAMDGLKILAESHRVELIWGERPRQWPVQLDE